MANILTEFAKTRVEKLINGVIAESSYICCFTCIAKDFEEERSGLERERETVKQLVDVATSRGEDVQANTLSWEEEADKLIQDDTKTNQKRFFGFCPHCIWRYKRGKELTNKKEQMKRLIETGKQLSIGLPARLPDVERYSSQHYIPFKSRESKYKELLDALKDDNNYITGLQGMVGTGKTTLAKEVGKELEQSKQFTRVIDTTVSSSPDIRKIQDDIAGPLRLKFDEYSESDRPKQLLSRLTNGEKILLILDDVWGEINFDEIGIPQSGNHKGCRILVTTRNPLVCNRLGCSKTIQLYLLSEEDAWIMFQRHADLSKISTKNLLEKGRKIANECKRLPIAIAVIASSLKGVKCLEEWEGALNFLQKDMSMQGVDYELLKIFKCLKFSYDNMKNEKAKRLFLLCSVFQEDEEISTERLTRLGIGGGLFGEDYGSYEDARIQVGISEIKLLDSCLLLEANQSRVKMHNLVRGAAQWIANKRIKTVKLYDKNQKAMVERETNIKYLLCEGNLKDLFSFKLDGSKLEILIVTVRKDEDCHNVIIEVLNSFFQKSTGLRVFHLIYDHYRKITLSLPQSIQSLKNVRSLLITHVDLGDISALGNLQSLETLDLKDCNIDELPPGIAYLEKFRLLNLESCIILRNNPFEVIERCSSLEELYFTGSFNAFCREINFPKLQRFCIDEYWRPVNDSSSKYVSVVDKGEVFLSETTLKYCMQTAKVLRLRRSERGWRNRIPNIVSIDQGMNDIVELSLSCISQLQYLIDTTHIAFQGLNVLSKLVVLKLDRMENLEKLFNGSISLDSLKKLEKLSIKDCKHLQSLFKCKLNLCYLKTIKLQNCPMLVSLFQSLSSGSLMLLEKLQIANCERLENIIIDGLDNDNKSPDSMFPNLKVFDVEECPRLESMLPFLSAQELPALEAINIRSCDGLKYIFGQYHSMFSYRLHICERVQCLPIQSYSVCSIKEINLSHFSKIKSVFILSITPKMLLETLTIKNCDELKNIIIDINHESGNNWGDVFPKLKRIHVEDCIQLEYIFGHYDHDQQSHNEIHLDLPALKYIKLCSLPRLVAVCTKQYRPTFPHLEEPEHKECSHHAIKSFGDFIIHPISESLDSTIVKEYGDGQIHIEDVDLEGSHETTHTNNQVSSNIKDQTPKDDKRLVSRSRLSSIASQFPSMASKGFPDGTEVQETSGHELASSHENGIESNEFEIVETTMKQTVEAKQEFVENNVSGLEITSDSQYLKETEDQSIQEGSKLEKTVATTSSTFSDSRKERSMQPEQKGINLCFEAIAALANAKKITSPTHSEPNISSSGSLVTYEHKTFSQEYGEGQRAIPSFSISTKDPLTIEEVDLGDSWETTHTNNQDFDLFLHMESVYQQFQAESKGHDNGNENPNAQNTKEFVTWIKVQATLGHKLTSSQIKMKQTPEEEHELVENVPGLEIPSVALLPTNSEEVINEQSIDQQRSMNQQHSHGNNFVKEIKNQSIQDCSTSEKIVEATLSTISETKNVPPIKLISLEQKGVKEGNVLTNAKTITSSTQLQLEQNVNGGDSLENTKNDDNQVSLNDDAFMKVISITKEHIPKDDPSLSNSLPLPFEGHPSQKVEGSNPPSLAASISIRESHTTEDVDVKDFQETIRTNNNDQVFLNDDAAMKVSSNIEDQTSKDDEFRISEPKPSPSNNLPFHLTFQTPMPSEGNSSQIMENSSSPSNVFCELEQLVSENCFDYENLSLLTDFLVKHPSVLLRDASLSNKYKGYAYGCLAELLQFLQTHSVLDVLGSSHSKFVKLLQDVRSFAFDKDWLDGVEKRALFPADVQFSRNALQTLPDLQQHVTKEVEEMRLKINIVNQHVEDLKHQLTFSEGVLVTIIQQKEKVLETRAALSAPLGY